MSYQINVDASTLSHTAKKIKKTIKEQSPNNKSTIGHNEIINIITKTINDQKKSKWTPFPSSLNNEDTMLDLQDLEMLNQALKKSFKKYANIEDITFINKIKREMISELFNCFHEISLIDYLRNYNVINNRNFNNGIEITTYTQIVDSIDSWVKDIYERFKEELIVKGTNNYPVFQSANEFLDMSVFEINFFIKNKDKNLPNIIHEALYAVMKNEHDVAKKILLKEIKNIYIQHQESTDEVLVDNIKKYHIHLKTQKDIEVINRYKDISKNNFAYIGRENVLINNNIDLIKSKIMTKKEPLFLPHSSPSKHIMLTGVYGMGAFSTLSSQLYQHIANDRGFIHFDYQSNQIVETESTNRKIEDLKSFIRKKGQGQKLNVLNYRQLLKLKEDDVIAFVNKNRMVYINLKVHTAMTKYELNCMEQQLKMIVIAVSKANSVLNNRYLVNLSSLSFYSQDFFNVMNCILPICSEKGIVFSVFFHEHLTQLNRNQKHEFFNLFHNYLIFKQSNPVELLKDLNIEKNDNLAKEIEEQKELSFLFFENRKRKEGSYSAKIFF